ncbi:MAG: sugar ABC transporter ATP-binding protein, partial [Lachnospiraceae bacterium]|nr:sugar ABC transporter ATP-binding protein [Lachnospiraceae bacterium]
LDLVVKDNIRAAIREINEKYSTTVVLTTHDIGDIEELCSRILIIDKGSLIYDGSLEELKEQYGTTRKVVLEVADVARAREIPLHEYLGVEPDSYEIQADGENSTVTVSFDKNRMQVSEVIGQMMQHTQVKDIKILETELAEIVKAIYCGQEV